MNKYNEEINKRLKEIEAFNLTLDNKPSIEIATKTVETKKTETIKPNIVAPKPTTKVVVKKVTPKIEDTQYKIINIKFSNDGIANISNIDLGQVGDSSMTQLVFDTTELDWNKSNITDYDTLLSFFNSSKPHSDTNPLVYKLEKDNTFVIPSDLTDGSSYKVLYVLREVLDDDTKGNLDEPEELAKEEIFISSEMTAKTSSTNEMYDPSINIDFLSNIKTNTEGDEIEALEKDVFNLNYEGSKIITSDKVLGNKFDNYIKLVKLNVNNILGLTDLFVIFKRNNDKIIIRLDKNQEAWVPPEITKQQGQVKIGIIASDLTERVYFTNTVNGTINNNYLGSIDWLVPNAFNTTASLLTSDNYYFVSIDDYIINTKE